MHPSQIHPSEDYALPREGTEFVDGAAFDLHASTVPTSFAAVKALRDARQHAQSSMPESDVPSPELGVFDHLRISTSNLVRTRNQATEAA